MTMKISDAEHEVMAILWAEAPLTAADIAGRIPANRDWSMQTVKTLISRLVAKAAVATKRDGRRFLYSPLVDRDAYLTSASQRLVDRLFGGRVSPLVAHLAEADSLTDQDIAEIEQLLRELKS